MGIAYSSFISLPFYITENWMFEPYYQIDIFHERSLTIQGMQLEII